MMREALATRMGRWKRIRLFIVGDGGAGKSSVRRLLKGDPFNENHDLTDGAEIETLDLNDWKVSEYDHKSVIDIKEFEHNSKAQTAPVARLHKRSHSFGEMFKSWFSPSGGSPPVIEQGPMPVMHSVSAPSLPSTEVVTSFVNQRLKTRMVESTTEGVTFHIWDCGGQKIYYNTHHFFFTSMAIYLLVVDLSMSDFETHGLERLHFWVRSIRSYAPKAPIRIVATHTDRLSEEQVTMKVNKIFESMLSLRHFGPMHSRDHIFAISCASTDVSTRDSLRSQLLQLAKTCETECLLKWILFFDSIYSTVSIRASLDPSAQSQLSVLKMDEAKKIAEKCGLINEYDVVKALDFFHKQGLALYFNEPKLKDIIFLQPKRLVDAFRAIITANIHPDRECNMSPSLLYDNEIEQLRECGHMSSSMLRRMWDNQGYSDETQGYLRALMVKFGLAVEDSQTSSNLVFPCLVLKGLEMNNQWKEKMKRWEYKIESLAPPLGFSSLLVVRLLQLATEDPPTWQLFKDGCVVILRRLELNVKVHPSSVELHLESAQKDVSRMAEVMTQVVNVIRSVQKMFVCTKKLKDDIQGSLKGKCFKCDAEMMVVEDLNKLSSRYSQYCCKECRVKLGLYPVFH